MNINASGNRRILYILGKSAHPVCWKGGMFMSGIFRRAAKVYARIKSGLMEHAYLVTLGAVIAVIAGAAMYTSHLENEQKAAMQAAANAPETAQSAAPTPRVTPLPTIAPLVLVKADFTPKIAVVQPVEGKIVRAYAPQAVLWEALGVWQVHEAIDIAAQADDAVLSAMDGRVVEAAMDALWGWKIRIAHDDGSECIYAGLSCSLVHAGENVVRGQEIGRLLESVPCEAELVPHLHLERWKNGAAQDPEGILPE